MVQLWRLLFPQLSHNPAEKVSAKPARAQKRFSDNLFKKRKIKPPFSAATQKEQTNFSSQPSSATTQNDKLHSQLFSSNFITGQLLINIRGAASSSSSSAAPCLGWINIWLAVPRSARIINFVLVCNWSIGDERVLQRRALARPNFCHSPRDTFARFAFYLREKPPNFFPKKLKKADNFKTQTFPLDAENIDCRATFLLLSNITFQ